MKKNLLMIAAFVAIVVTAFFIGCQNISEEEFSGGGGGGGGGGRQDGKIKISGTMSLKVSQDLLEVADIEVRPFMLGSASSRAASGDGSQNLTSPIWTWTQPFTDDLSSGVGFSYSIRPKNPGRILDRRKYEFFIEKRINAVTSRDGSVIDNQTFGPQKIVKIVEKDDSYAFDVDDFIEAVKTKNNCFLISDSNGKLSKQETNQSEPEIVSMTALGITDGSPPAEETDDINPRKTGKVAHVIGRTSSFDYFSSRFFARLRSPSANNDANRADFILIERVSSLSDLSAIKQVLKAGIQGKPIVLLEPSAVDIADFWSAMGAGLTTDFIKELVTEDPSIKNVVGAPFYNQVRRMKGKRPDDFKDCLVYKVHKNGVHTVLPPPRGELFTDRDYGRFADSIIAGIEEDDGLYPHLNYLHKSSNDASLPDVMSAQKEEYTFKVKADHGRSAETVKVQFFIWQVYSFDEKADYYLVQQTVTLQNSQLHCGPSNKYYWWKPRDNEYCYGAYLKDVSMKNTLVAASNIYSVAPNTTSGSSSYTEGFSWNIGGNIGFNMSGPTGGISGGVSYNNSTSRTVADISAKYTESTTSPKWEYIGGNEPWHDWEWDWGNACYIYTHGEAPATLKGDVILNNNWVWKVENPSGTYSFDAETYVKTHWLKDFVTRGTFSDDHDFKYETYIDPTTNTTNIKMNPPSRTMDNYLMYYSTPSDWDEQKIGRFRTFLTEYFKLWQPNIDIYSVDEDGNQQTTKDHFAEVMADFENNTQLFKDNKFTGTFTFKIKNSKAQGDLVTKDLTIN